MQSNTSYLCLFSGLSTSKVTKKWKLVFELSLFIVYLFNYFRMDSDNHIKILNLKDKISTDYCKYKIKIKIRWCEMQNAILRYYILRSQKQDNFSILKIGQTRVQDIVKALARCDIGKHVLLNLAQMYTILCGRHCFRCQIHVSLASRSKHQNMDFFPLHLKLTVAIFLHSPKFQQLYLNLNFEFEQYDYGI